MRGLTSIFTFTIATALFATTRGQALAQADATAANRDFPWEGEVTGSAVYIRSGAGSNYYPTTKVGPGTRLLVVEEKFGWYQIVPPIGSFSYIDASLVQKSEDGKTATVSQENVYVRAGSDLERRKSSTQVMLPKGATVTILGEADGFYKITPPKGAHLFISAQYVARVPERTRSGLLEKYMSEGGPVSSSVTPDPTIVATSVKNPEKKIEPRNNAATPNNTAMANGSNINDGESRAIKTDVAIPLPIDDKVAAGTSSETAPVNVDVNRRPMAKPMAKPTEPVAIDSTPRTPPQQQPTRPIGDAGTTAWIETQFAANDGSQPSANASANINDYNNTTANSNTSTNSNTGTPAPAMTPAAPSPFATSPPSNAKTVDGRNVTTIELTANAGSGRYDAEVQKLEAEMQAELRKPIRDQKLASLRDRFGPISIQSEEQVAQEIAKIRIRQLNDRIALQNSRMALASEAQELDAYRKRSDEERIAIARRVANYSAPVSYDVVGELRKSMAFGAEKRRFRLVNPKTGATTAYVDVPASVSPNVEQWIGQIVGIKASGRDYSNAARMTFYVASSVTPLGTGSGVDSPEKPIDRDAVGTDDPAGTITFSSPTPTFSSGPAAPARPATAGKAGSGSTMTVETHDAPKTGNSSVEKQAAPGNTPSAVENTDMEPLEPIEK